MLNLLNMFTIKFNSSKVKWSKFFYIFAIWNDTSCSVGGESAWKLVLGPAFRNA